jgi:eukaryotic-like serine/threonine-protein kinase
VRRALLLALGDYGDDAISPAQREALDRRVRDWYENDPDPGIHSAAQRLLREPGSAPRGSSISARRGRRWYVTAEGQTMSVISPQSSVRMGSPSDEAGRQPAPDSPAEPLHNVLIPRGFAIATTELAVAEFRRFLEANAEAKRGYQDPKAPRRMAEIVARSVRLTMVQRLR